MDDLRVCVSEWLGCESVFTSSDPNEVRCLVESPKRDAVDVHEWLIRRLPRVGMKLTRTMGPTPEASAPSGGQGHFLDAQLDAMLWLPKRLSRTEEPKTKEQLSTHVLEVMYDDIPHYTALQQSPTEILSGLMTNHATSRMSSVGRLRGIVTGTDGTELAVFVYEHQSLGDLLKFNQSLLDDDEVPNAAVSDMKRRFLVYQLWKLVSSLHEQGLCCHESLVPSRVWLTDDMWVRLGTIPHTIEPQTDPGSSNPFLTVEQITSSSPTERWCCGDLSNFEYLMILNAAAGRRLIDSVFHPVFPWVSDFSSNQGGWRDLSKSKFRLNKGDNQLDRNYESSVVPHHITESLSEITFYIYMARRTPMPVLRQIVRSNFQPKEYPTTIERMYHWTPDECIPEFFSDASVFSTIHGDSVMPDLVLPDWCEDAQDFIRSHRLMLESEQVSLQLPKWIDLNFGVCLSGEAAVHNKNVPLRTKLGAGHMRKSSGFVQLFRSAHPQRRTFNTTTHGSSLDGADLIKLSNDESDRIVTPSVYDTSLQSAIQIAEEAMSDSSFFVPAENPPHSQLQGILSSPAVSEKKSLSASFVKLKKKHRSRPKSLVSGDTSPVSPGGRETGQSRSPTVARFAHAIPKFFGSDSPHHHSVGSSDHGSLTAVSTPVNHGNSVHSLPSGPIVGGQEAGRGGTHSRPPSGVPSSYSSPPTPLNSSMSGHALSGTHIFRDLWHQLSKPEDEESNDPTEDGNSVSDLDGTGTDFDNLDEISLLLLRACPPISVRTDIGPVDQQRREGLPSSVVLQPVYELPTSWKRNFRGDESVGAASIAVAEDLFSLGCLMTEIYTGRPLFSASSLSTYCATYWDACSAQPGTTKVFSWPGQYIVEEQLKLIPTDVKNIILELVHPLPRHRISSWRTRYSDWRESRRYWPNSCIPNLHSPGSLSTFPPGFQTVYDYFSQLCRADHWWDRLAVTRNYLQPLVRLPDDAFQVALPCLLSFFKSKSYTDAINTTQVCAATVFLLDSLTRRIGRASIRLELHDVLLRVYERSDLPQVLKLCMSTPEVLRTITITFGPARMLRHFFPAILDWLTTPPAYRSNQDYEFGGEKGARHHPLFSTESTSMLTVTLGELSSSDFLGPSIAVKYVLPSLLPLLGKIQPKWVRLAEERSIVRQDTRSSGVFGSRSAFGGRNGDGVHVAYAPKQVLYESHYVADTILLVCRELPASIASESILPHLCDVMPRLLDVAENVSSTKIDGVPDDLAREVYVTCRVLRHVVRSMSEQSVQRDFLQKRASMIIDLLNRIQPPFLHPSTAEAVLSSIKSSSKAHNTDRPSFIRHNSAPVSASARRSNEIANRLHILQTSKASDLRAFTAVGVARTLTGALQKVGAEAAMSATGVLQSVDAFLVRCAAIYSELEVSDYQWRMASEVVSEFCSPLRTLFGSETFSKIFPSVQASSVLQMLLLPNVPNHPEPDQPRLKEEKNYHRQSTISTDRAMGDDDAATDQVELEALVRNVPDLLQFAYRAARLNGIKTASFLRITMPSRSVWNQDLNESIFLLQEERKKRRATSSSGKAGGETAWLRPRVINYFFGRQEDPSRVNAPSIEAGRLNEIGRSWSLCGEIRYNTRAHSSCTRSIHVDQDEDLVVSASKNGSCRVWRLASYPSQATGTVHFESTNLISARSLEDGKRAVATSSTMVYVWDIRTSQVMFQIPFGEEGVTSCSPLCVLPFKHYQDFAQSTRTSSSREAPVLQGNADFVVSTTRKLFLVDARTAPQVVADWRVDGRDTNFISTTALLTTASNPAGFIATGTTSGQVYLTDKRMGKCISCWQALPDARVVKIVQYSPSYVLIVGSDREARVWKIDEEKHPRMRMIVTNVPEGVRETQIHVQAYSDAVLLYVAVSAKLYTTRLIHDTSPEARRSDIPTVRLESWSLVDNNFNSNGGTSSVTSGSGDRSTTNSPERGRLSRTKMSAQSMTVLPLRQVLLLGGDDGTLRTCV